MDTTDEMKSWDELIHEDWGAVVDRLTQEDLDVLSAALITPHLKLRGDGATRSSVEQGADVRDAKLPKIAAWLAEARFRLWCFEEMRAGRMVIVTTAEADDMQFVGPSEDQRSWIAAYLKALAKQREHGD